MRFAPYLFCVGLATLAAFSCSSTTTTTTAVVRPELVAVDPADFLGSVRCAAPDDGAGGASDGDGDSSEGDASTDSDDGDRARSYVATLFDVTPRADGSIPDPGPALASSLPTTCLKPVTFAFVVTGRRYLAEVDAYRESPSELIPLSAGSRLMSNASGARVVASWSAVCGGYRPSPDAGTESAGAGGTPPGIITYDQITQTPHDCGRGLH